MVRHLLPVGIFTAILFGLAPIIEVRTQTPIFQWANSVKKDFRDSASDLYYDVLANSIVREQYSKEDRGHVRRIGTSLEGNVEHLGP